MRRLTVALDRPPIQADLMVVLLGIVLCTGGCRGNAYRDVYQQKMAAEIRTLEDQLYAADYENKVLRQKLHRAELEEDAARALTPDDEEPREEDEGRRDLPSGLGEEATRPDTRLLPPPSGIPRDDDDDSMEDRRIDVPGDNPPSSAPGPGLVPPDLDDLEMPEIEMGSPAPPRSATGEPELPPNRIPKTEAQERLEQSMLPPPQPVALAIHPGLSGSHTFDDEDQDATSGIYLVIQFIGEDGKPVDMRGTEIDADLSVVVLDPTPDLEDPRLGRWDFPAEEIAALRRDAPTDSLHVALPWNETKPAGDTVTAFVRLSNGGQKLEGKADVLLTSPKSIAGWQKAVR